MQRALELQPGEEQQEEEANNKEGSEGSEGGSARSGGHLSPENTMTSRGGLSHASVSSSDLALSLFNDKRDPKLAGQRDEDIGATASERLVMRLTDELPQMNIISRCCCHSLWCILPCLAAGDTRWVASRHHRLEDWRWSEAEEFDAEAADASSVRPSFFTNGLASKTPVLDSAASMTFKVSGMHAAVLRLKPTTTFTECWDALLFLSALAQFLTSGGNLVYMMFFRLENVLTNGKLPTFWWCWCCWCSALLVLHKKIHARWWSRTNDDKKRGSDATEFTCCRGLIHVRRTASPIALLTPAPGVPEQPWVTHKQKKVNQALCDRAYRRIKKRLLQVRPWFYRYYCQLKNGDWVVINSQPPWRPYRGALGKLLPKFEGEDGFRIKVGNGVVVTLQRDEFVLQDELVCVDRNRPGFWHDQLTPAMMKALVCAWLLILLAILLLPEDSVTDDEGFLTLHLLKSGWESNSVKWSHTLTGIMAAFQLALIAVEGSMRAVHWAAMRFLLLFFYRGW